MSEASADRQGRDPAPAVTRSMAVLGLLAEAPGPLTLTEIANALGLAKSSTANLCLALEAAMMVQRVPLGYQLGRRTVELGGAFAAQFNQVREFYGACAASPRSTTRPQIELSRTTSSMGEKWIESKFWTLLRMLRTGSQKSANSARNRSRSRPVGSSVAGMTRSA